MDNKLAAFYASIKKLVADYMAYCDAAIKRAESVTIEDARDPRVDSLVQQVTEMSEAFTEAATVIEDIINTLENLPEQGGLPAVTVADNNKMLQVVNGKWEPVAFENSALKIYIDAYIAGALGGEY